MKKVFTLCFILGENQILLGEKKTGFGMGKWNGFGGLVEPGEEIAAAAIRECREECGLAVKEVEQRGLLTFTFTDGLPTREIHVFTATDFSGEPKETSEMRPQWFSLVAIPYEAMWESDREWLPLLLAGKEFSGQFDCQDYETIDKIQVSEVAPTHSLWHIESKP